jgi:glycolate oxidase
LPQLISKVKELGRRYGFRSVCYGHAGDGNVHVNILKGDLNEEQWNGVVQQGIRELFREVAALGGTLSGEHGVGWVQQTYLPEVVGRTQQQLMRGIKEVFDPRGILNPCKIFSIYA